MMAWYLSKGRSIPLSTTSIFRSCFAQSHYRSVCQFHSPSSTSSSIGRRALVRTNPSTNWIQGKNNSPGLQICHYFSDTKSTTTESNAYSDSNNNRRTTHLVHSLQDGTLRSKLKQGHPTVGVVTGFHNDTDHVETLGLLGYDFLWADAEHSCASPSTVAALILAAERRGMPTLVRIGYGYQDIIGHSQKYLVAGAQGIILPNCQSKEDAEKIVKAVKFPPMGERGLAGERWNSWGLGEGGSLKDRVEVCNQNSIVGIIVESQKGIDALDEILSVEEIDFVFVAPTDLSADMGYHGEIRHPKVRSKIEDIGKRIRAAGISSGMLALTPDDYTYWRNRGFQVMCCVAHNMFVDGAKHLMNEIVKHELKGVPTLKKAAKLLIASNLTQDEIGSLRDVFVVIDKNGDGQLSLKEIDLALESGKFSFDLKEKLRGLRDDLRLAGEDCLDWKHFLAGTMPEGLTNEESKLHLAFDQFRKAQDGNMSISDLNDVFGGEDIAQQIMQEVDTDGDGRMSFEEFKSAVASDDDTPNK